jgi:hypothetical protein
MDSMGAGHRPPATGLCFRFTANCRNPSAIVRSWGLVHVFGGSCISRYRGIPRCRGTPRHQGMSWYQGEPGNRSIPRYRKFSDIGVHPDIGANIPVPGCRGIRRYRAIPRYRGVHHDGVPLSTCLFQALSVYFPQSLKTHIPRWSSLGCV